MSMSPDKARTAITSTIKSLAAVSASAPMSAVLPLFRDAKLDELANVYSKGPLDERKDIYNLLVEMYPTEARKIESIKESKD